MMMMMLLVRMTEAMAAAGADVAVVVTPSYYKSESLTTNLALTSLRYLLQVE